MTRAANSVEIGQNADALLTPADAARVLAISEKQLRSLAAAGQIKYINIGLGDKRETRRYDPADLEEFRERRRPRVEPEVFPDTGPSSPFFPRRVCPEDAGRRGSKDSYVYFIAAGGKVKIGRARSIKARMNALQSGCPYAVHLIHYERGGEKLERTMHKRFAAYRDRLEWFRIEGDLAEFLRSIGQ